MVEEQATVVAVSDQQLTLRCETKTSCGSCQARQVCGHGALAESMSQASQSLTVKLPSNLGRLTPGDKVVIGVSGEQLTRNSIRIYMWPLLALIVGMALGQTIETTYGDLWSLILGFGSFYWVFRYVIVPNDSKLSAAMEPTVVKKLQT